jgi:hypothetical protein
MMRLRISAMSKLPGNKFMWLFIFLLAVLISYPYSLAHYAVYRSLVCLAILFTVYAVDIRRSLLMIALVLAVPSHTVSAAEIKSSAAVVNTFLSFGFDVFIVVVIFRRIFAKTSADSESIYGALCIYLIVGFSFSNIFLLVAYFQPRAFYLDPATNDHATFQRLDSVYYSYGTMTSLGATGITPVTADARLLTIIEALLGVLFLAVLVSRLLSAYGKLGVGEER